MRTVWIVAACVTGALVTGAARRAPSLMADAATADAVRAVKRGIVEGHRTRNRAALDRLYAEDYSALDPRGGVRTKADSLSGLATDACLRV